MEWVAAGIEPPPELASLAGVSDLTARVLYRRGFRDPAAIKSYMNPPAVDDEWGNVELPGVRDVVAILAQALDEELAICVSGGEKAGDQIAIALCVGGLRLLGFRASYFLASQTAKIAAEELDTQREKPDVQLRLELGGENASLLILSDRYGGGAQRASIKPEILPADDPLRLVGRAAIWWATYKALAKSLAKDGLQSQFADLIAFSTIVDAASMTGLNRALVIWGLPPLFYRPRVGLAALMQAAKLIPPVVPNSEYVDHGLGARLRSAERSGLATASIELLLAQTVDRARDLSVEIEANYHDERIGPKDENDGLGVAKLKIESFAELTDLQVILAHEIAGLGPYGLGNREPLLASRKVRLVNATSTGLSRRHTRLVVEDEAGHRLTGIWWHKNPAAIAREWGDVAYYLRLDHYRGAENVQLQVVDFRFLANESAPQFGSALPFAIVDERGIADRKAALAQWRAAGELRVWSESAEEIPGASARKDLRQGSVLVICTAPPGPSVLREVLERVRPDRVVLLSKRQEAVAAAGFLRRLGGLAKWVLANRDGVVEVSELAGRLGELDATVVAGFEVLAAKGLLGYSESKGRVQLTREGTASPYSGERLKQLLAETGAYRRYFARAPADEIMRVNSGES